MKRLEELTNTTPNLKNTPDNIRKMKKMIAFMTIIDTRKDYPPKEEEEEDGI